MAAKVRAISGAMPASSAEGPGSAPGVSMSVTTGMPSRPASAHRPLREPEPGRHRAATRRVPVVRHHDHRAPVDDRQAGTGDGVGARQLGPRRRTAPRPRRARWGGRCAGRAAPRPTPAPDPSSTSSGAASGRGRTGQRARGRSPSAPSTQACSSSVGTTASARPASSARSALWERSPTASPRVASATRGPGEADGGARLDRPHVAQPAVGGQHAAGGRRQVHADGQQAGVGVAPAARPRCAPAAAATPCPPACGRRPSG